MRYLRQDAHQRRHHRGCYLRRVSRRKRAEVPERGGDQGEASIE